MVEYILGHQQIFVIIIQQVLSAHQHITMQPNQSPNNLSGSQTGYRSPAYGTTSQGRNPLTSSQVGSSSPQSGSKQKITIFNWATHVQFVVKAEEKRAGIKMLLSQNYNYFHSCIIYTNSQFEANQIFTNLSQQFSSKAKVVLNAKQAAKYWASLQNQQLRILIVSMNPIPNSQLTSFSIPNCVDFIINVSVPPIKKDLEHRVRKSVGQNEDKLYQGVVVNFCSSNYEKEQMNKFLKSTNTTQMEESTQNKYKFSDYFVKIPSKETSQPINRTQSSIEFDYQSAKQKKQENTQSDISWATHLQMAVLENNKATVTSKIILSNFDNFNSFIVYAKDYHSAAAARDALSNKIKQKVVLVTSTLQLQQNFKKFVNNEFRILFITTDLAKRYLNNTPVSIINKADCIINMCPVADAQQLRLKTGKKVQQKHQMQKGVVVHFTNTSVNELKNTAERALIESITRAYNLQARVVEIISDQDYNLMKYVTREQGQKNNNVTINVDFKKQSLSLEKNNLNDNINQKIDSPIKQKSKIQEIEVETKDIYSYDWANYLFVQSEQQHRSGKLLNFINLNIKNFNRCIAYVKTYDKAKSLLDRLDQRVKQKTSIVGLSESNTNEYLNKLKQGDLKIIIFITSTEGKDVNFIIPDNVDLVIFDSMPKMEVFQRRVAKSGNSIDSCLKGAVVCLYYNKADQTELDRFTQKYNNLKIDHNYKLYDLAPFLKQEIHQNISKQKILYPQNSPNKVQESQQKQPQVQQQKSTNPAIVPQITKPGVVSVHSSEDEKKQQQKQSDLSNKPVQNLNEVSPSKVEYQVQNQHMNSQPSLVSKQVANNFSNQHSKQQSGEKASIPKQQGEEDKAVQKKEQGAHQGEPGLGYNYTQEIHVKTQNAQHPQNISQLRDRNATVRNIGAKLINNPNNDVDNSYTQLTAKLNSKHQNQTQRQHEDDRTHHPKLQPQQQIMPTNKPQLSEQSPDRNNTNNFAQDRTSKQQQQPHQIQASQHASPHQNDTKTVNYNSVKVHGSTNQNPKQQINQEESRIQRAIRQDNTVVEARNQPKQVPRQQSNQPIKRQQNQQNMFQQLAQPQSQHKLPTHKQSPQHQYHSQSQQQSSPQYQSQPPHHSQPPQSEHQQLRVGTRPIQVGLHEEQLQNVIAGQNVANDKVVKLEQKLGSLYQQAQTINTTVSSIYKYVSQSMPSAQAHKQQMQQIRSSTQIMIKKNAQQQIQQIGSILVKQQQPINQIKNQLSTITASIDDRLKAGTIDSIASKQGQLLNAIKGQDGARQQQIKLIQSTMQGLSTKIVETSTAIVGGQSTALQKLQKQIGEQYKQTISENKQELEKLSKGLQTQIQNNHQTMTQTNDKAFNSILWEGKKNKQQVITENSKIVQTIVTQKQNKQNQLATKKAELAKQYEAQTQQQRTRLTEMKNSITNKKQTQSQRKLKEQFNNFAHKNKAYVQEITQLRQKCAAIVTDNKSAEEINKKYIEERSKNEKLEAEVIKLRMARENQATILDQMKNKLIFKQDQLKQANRKLKLSEDAKNSLGAQLSVSRKCISDTKQQIMSLYSQRYKNPTTETSPSKPSKNMPPNQQPTNIFKSLNNLDLLPLVKDNLIPEIKNIDLQVLYLSKIAKLDYNRDENKYIKQSAEYKDYAFVCNKQQTQNKNNSCSYLMAAVNSIIGNYDSLKDNQASISKYLTRLEESIRNLSEKTNKSVSEGAQCSYVKIIDHESKDSKLNAVLANISDNFNKMIAKIITYFKQKEDLVAAVNRNNQTIDGLTVKNKNLTAQKQNLETEVAKQTSLKQQLQRNLNTANATISGLNTAKAELQRKLSETIKQYEGVIRKWSEDYNKLKQQKQDLSKLMESTVTKLESDLGISKRDYSDLKKRTDDAAEQQQRKYTTLKTNSASTIAQWKNKHATDTERMRNQYRNLENSSQNKLQETTAQLQSQKVRQLKAAQTKYQTEISILVSQHQKKQKDLRQQSEVQINKARISSQDFATAINNTIEATLNIKLAATPDNYKQKVGAFALQVTQKLGKINFLSESQIYKKMLTEQKNYVYDSIKNLLPKKKIAYTKTLFQGFQTSSQRQHDVVFTGWLYKIHNKDNLLMIMTLANGRQLCCFSQAPYSQDRANKGGRGFMMSIQNRRQYLLKTQHDGKAISYDEYMVKFGNNELLIKNDLKFSVIIGKQYMFFNTGNDRTIDFIGQEKDEGDYTRVEFHQVFFE